MNRSSTADNAEFCCCRSQTLTGYGLRSHLLFDVGQSKYHQCNVIQVMKIRKREKTAQLAYCLNTGHLGLFVMQKMMIEKALEILREHYPKKNTKPFHYKQNYPFVSKKTTKKSISIC